MNTAQLKNEFIKIYGGSIDDLRVFSSPGRVNLIGEHTDYNGGFVFPAALSVSSTIVVRKTDDNLIKLAATDLPDRVVANIDELDKYKNLKWGNYQLGFADELKKAHYDIVGCEMLFHDTVPLGAGLSSSAAIEVVTAICLATFSNEKNNIKKDVDMIEMALIGQKAENNYVGVNCGIMDQFASAMGKENHAIFLDCKDLSYKHVPLNLEGYTIVISNTNKKRSLADSKYNERRSECEKGLEILKTNLPEKNYLGEISLEEFNKNSYLIEDEVIFKRVKHVIEEDDRVLKSIEFLNSGDIENFGKLMTDSHNSLRDLYQVTGTELDTLVEATLKQEGVLGARMTGAGFGGCTVAIVKNESLETLKNEVMKIYEEKIGYPPTFYISNVGDGGREIK